MRIAETVKGKDRAVGLWVLWSRSHMAMGMKMLWSRSYKDVGMRMLWSRSHTALAGNQGSIPGTDVKVLTLVCDFSSRRV